jgi:hypothetical protein
MRNLDKQMITEIIHYNNIYIGSCILNLFIYIAHF